MNTSVTHVAGLVVTFCLPEGPIVRQRCAWCGALLMEIPLKLVSYPVGQDPTFPAWEAFSMVRVDGNLSMSLTEELLSNGDTKVPDDSCMWIDPSVTA